MLRIFVLLAILAYPLIAAPPLDQPVRPTPLVKVAEPSPAKLGHEVLLTGQYLGKDSVESVYLTVGDDIHPVEIKAQSNDTIRIVIPANLKAGRFGIMVMVKGDAPRYIDEPLFLNVIE